MAQPRFEILKNQPPTLGGASEPLTNQGLTDDKFIKMRELDNRGHLGMVKSPELLAAYQDRKSKSLSDDQVKVMHELDGRGDLGLAPPEKVAEYNLIKGSGFDMSSARQRNEAFRAQEETLARTHIESQLPDGGQLVDPEEEAGLGTQIKMLRFEDNATLNRFLNDPKNKAIPEGSTGVVIETIDGDKIPGYTQPGDNKVYRLNKEGLSPGDFAHVVAPFTNVEDVASMAATAIPGGPLVRGAAEVASAMGGRVIDELVDNKFFNQEDTAGDIAKKAAGSGALQLGSSLIGSGLERAAGSKPIKDKFVDEVSAAASRTGSPSISAGDTGKSPFFRRAQNVLSDLTPEGRARKAERKTAPARAIQKQIQDGIDAGEIPVNKHGNIDYEKLGASLTDEKLFEVSDSYQAAINAEMKRKLSRKSVKGGVSMESGGQSIIDGIYKPGGYNDIVTGAVSKMYDQAKQYAVDDNAKFRLTGLKAALRDIKKKPFLLKKRKDGEVAKDIDLTSSKELKKIFDELNDVLLNQSDVIAKDGSVLTEVNPSVVIDNLIKVRGQLYDLSQPDPKTGLHTPETRNAGKLYNVFTNALENSSSSPRFNTTWRQANNTHREKIKTLETFDLAQFFDKDRIGAGELAYKKVLQSSEGKMTSAKADALKILLKPKEYDNFKNAFFQDLISEPTAITSRIKGLSLAEKKLIPEDSMRILKSYAVKVDRLNGNVVDKALRTIESKGERAKAILEKVPPREVLKVIKDVGIKKEAYRGALMVKLIKGATEETTDGLSIIPAKMVKEIKNLVDTGAWDNLSKSQQALLKDIDKLSIFIKETAPNVATSLEAVSISSKRANVLTPSDILGAQAEIVKYDLIGWLSQKQSVVDYVSRTGISQSSLPKLRGTVAYMIDVMNSLTNEQQREAQ